MLVPSTEVNWAGVLNLEVSKSLLLYRAYSTSCHILLSRLLIDCQLKFIFAGFDIAVGYFSTILVLKVGLSYPALTIFLYSGLDEYIIFKNRRKNKMFF